MSKSALYVKHIFMQQKYFVPLSSIGKDVLEAVYYFKIIYAALHNFKLSFNIVLHYNLWVMFLEFWFLMCFIIVLVDTWIFCSWYRAELKVFPNFHIFYIIEWVTVTGSLPNFFLNKTLLLSFLRTLLIQ